MKNIVVVGSSGHAKVVLDIIEKQGIYKVAGLIDAFRPVGDKTLGYSIIGTEIDLPKIIDEYHIHGFIVAIGDNFIRSKVSKNIQELCQKLTAVSAIHPSAQIGLQTIIGKGSVVMAGVVVNPSCEIGQFCILNTKSTLDHDSIMEDFSSLAPGVTTGGNCRVKNHTAISIGSTIRHGITIGEHSVVGAGALVLDEVQSFSVVYGTPAKKIRSRTKGEKYL